MHDHKPIAIDLFAGAGGTTLGLKKAGFDVRIAVDIDPYKAQTLSINHPSTIILGVPERMGDVRKINGKNLLKIGKIKSNKLSLLVGCPPCQGFSLQGKRDPLDKRNSLYLEFLRFIKELSPEMICFENVPGIMSFQSGKVVNDLQSKLNTLGYDVDLWTVDAKDYGLPQSRKRIFIIGDKKNVLHKAPSKCNEQIGVWDAIADLPVRRRRTTERKSIEYRFAPRSKYAKKMRGKRTFVSNCEMTVHSPFLIERFKMLKWGERDPSTWHHRLHPKKPAPTLTAGSRTRTACRPIHPYADRVLTVREGARLASFPDWYRFPEHIAEAWAQIGNSVPPIMAEAIFKQLNTF